jgi:hypothetical protein
MKTKTAVPNFKKVSSNEIDFSPVVLGEKISHELNFLISENDPNSIIKVSFTVCVALALDDD